MTNGVDDDSRAAEVRQQLSFLNEAFDFLWQCVKTKTGKEGSLTRRCYDSRSERRR